jgi:hypothetical protein
MLPSTPTFVGIDMALLNSPSSTVGKDINVRRTLQALQENFDTVGEHLSVTLAGLVENFEELLTRLTELAF